MSKALKSSDVAAVAGQLSLSQSCGGNKDDKSSAPQQKTSRLVVRINPHDEDIQKGNPTGRGWFFTLNNPTKDDAVALDKIKENKSVIFAAWQLEKGEQGTPHFQGFCLTEPIRWKAVREILGGRAWVTKKKGTNAECMTYCHNKDKEGFLDGPWQCGKLPSSDEKMPTRIKQMADDLAAGKSLLDIAKGDAITYMLHHRKAEAYINICKDKT